VVRAIDMAGNSVESSAELETLPIVSPAITSVPGELFSEEEKGLTLEGTSLPDLNILLQMYRKGLLFAEGATQADEKGNWEFTFEQPLRNGQYILTAQNQDSRGALSLVVESPEVLVKSKPIIQIGKLQLGMGGAWTFLLIVIAAGFIAGAWFYKKRQEKLSLRLLVVKTDMAKVFKLIQDDLIKLQAAIGTSTAADDEFMIKRLLENVKKMEGYLKKEIERLK